MTFSFSFFFFFFFFENYRHKIFIRRMINLSFSSVYSKPHKFRKTHIIFDYRPLAPIMKSPTRVSDIVSV